MGLLDGIKDAVSGAADAVAEVVKDGGMAAACKIAEVRVKELTGMDITVDTEDIPEDWKTWIMKTAISSICNDDTWDFLENSEYNKKKVDLWNERAIDKIVLRVKKDPEDDMHWVVCYPEWDKGTFSKTLYLDFYPRAKNWGSDAGWGESGARWWILRDEIVFGLQLYQLPGKCFYKSDWLENFEDVDPDGLLPTSTHKVRRWFQFRHWIIFWYPEAQWGWNYQWTTNPPKNSDGSDFSLDNVLSLPSMPSLSMPSISLPSLPDVSMPSLPDVSMPSISAPSLSAPSLSAPSMGSLPSIPDKPKRHPSRWDCHGYVELEGMKVKDDGKDIIFSNMKVTHFWENQENETKERQRWVLGTTSDEQAVSWKETLMGSGVEEGDAGGGCCTVA